MKLVVKIIVLIQILTHFTYQSLTLDNREHFLIILQQQRFQSIQQFFTSLKVPIIDWSIPITVQPHHIKKQWLKIMQFGDDFIVIGATKHMGFKKCFYKAIEFFSSKYSKFFIEVEEVYKTKNHIFVKFVAVDIVVD